MLFIGALYPKRVKYTMPTVEFLLPWGVRLSVPDNEFMTCWLYTSGVYEAAVTEPIVRLLDPGELAVDVGAHVGHMTAAMVRACGPHGRVIAFEPCPENYDQLARNTARWATDPSLASVTAIRAAVSDRCGQADLAAPIAFTQNSGVPHLESTGANDPGLRRWRVQVIDLTTALKDEPQPIALLKIDAEGHEFKVLAGARELLSRHAIRDIIFEEYEAWPARTHALLERFGYSLFRLAGTLDGPRLLAPNENEPLSEIIMPNYLATLEPQRVLRRFESSGWRCHGQHPCAAS